MNNDKMTKLISQSRKEKHLTQKELADLLGVTDKAVSKWERGLSFPDISLLPKLAQVLGISVNDLVSGEKTQTSPAKIAGTNNDPIKKTSNGKFLLAGLGIPLFACAILSLSISAIDMGLSWVLIPVSFIAVLWLIAIIVTYILNKNKIAASLLCGAVIFAATYYYSALNQAVTRDIARYGEFTGHQNAYIPQYTIVIIMLVITLLIVLTSSGILRKTLSGDTIFLLCASAITIIIISVLTVSSIMEYVDIHSLGVNPLFTILLLLTCLINCFSLAILLKRQLNRNRML